MAAAAAFAALPRPAAAQNVAVVVNGDPITTYDIEQRGRFNQLITHKPPVRQEVIDELISERLKLQVGKRYKLEIGDSEVDQAYAEMGKRMRMSPQQLTASLAQGGVDAATLKARIKADIAWQQIVRGKFQSSFQFREKDILAAAESRKKDDKDPAADTTGYEYALRPILFIVPKGSNEATIEARKKEAEALRTRFQNCELGLPFARNLRDVAVRDEIKKTSADLAPALRDILDAAGVGHLTNPETTAAGIELFAVCAKKETKVDAPGMREVRQEMFAEQFQTRSKRFLDELRRGAMIEVKEEPAKETTGKDRK
jgi:peptidyl-prolyl cis-trans isomerase SurA